MTAIFPESTPIPGRIKYGTTYLPGAHHARLSAQPVYAQDRRNIISIRYELRVSFWIANEDIGDMEDAQAILQGALLVPGQTLEFDDKGFGFTTIGLNSEALRDIEWGPQPIEFRAVPIGGSRAFECEWAVQWMVSTCSVSRGRGISLKELSYSLDMSIDAHGHLTKRIDGFARYYVPSKGASSFNNPIDLQYTNLEFPLQRGMRRVSQSRRIFPSHDGFSFSVTDTELPGGALPPDIIDGDVEFSMGNAGPGFAIMQASISGNFVTAPGVNPGVAAVRFLFILAEYVNRIRSVVNPGIKGTGNFKTAVWPKQLEWGHSIFTRRTRFNSTFIVNSGKISNLYGSIKMWEPLKNPAAGHNYDAWVKSMARSFGPGGHTGSVWDGGDAIYGLCDETTPQPIGVTDGQSYIDSGPNLGTFTCSQIEARQSWLSYSNRLIYRREEYQSKSKAVQIITGGVSAAATVFSVFGPGLWLATKATGHMLGKAAEWATEDTIQTHGPPDQYVAMVGSAVRVGHLPVIPELLEVEGRTVQPASGYGGASSIADIAEPIGDLLGCPVYRTSWAKVYEIIGTRSPGEEIVPPPNLPRGTD